MTVRVFRSTDTGAPALTGQAGKLIDVLDACLVNGLAAMSVASITRSGAVATVTLTAPHGLTIGSKGHRLTIAGATQTDYNVVDAAVTVTDADKFTYAVVNAPATPATGTITAKKNGAGWTKAFSGTNTAAYKQPAGSNGFYLNVDDTGTTTARLRGYETMTAVATGTGLFPMDSQLSGGLYGIKSATGDATARPWMLVTNGKLFHFISTANVTAWATVISSATPAGFSFGDIAGFNAGDVYSTVLIAGTGASYQNTHLAATTSSGFAANSGHYMPRAWTQLGRSTAVGKHADPAKTGTTFGIGLVAYPNVVDGGIYLCPVWMHEAPSVLRGMLPGMWAPAHTMTALANGTTFPGTGELTGKEFELVGAMNASTIGALALELSDTW